MSRLRSLILGITLLLSLISTLSAEYFVLGPVTTGIDFATGARPFRKDVNTLLGPERDLFLLALQSMQDADQEEKLSWFQLAGIHGCPPVPWDDVAAYPGRPRTGYPGYAPHNCGTFLPWHRAYLLLIENILSRNALRIAQTYSDEKRAEYVRAAESLRWPYWKWDGSSRNLPPIVQNRYITLQAPVGQITIKNPLESYTFHPVMTREQSMGYTVFNNRSTQLMSTETVRCPDINGRSNYGPIAQTLSNVWRALRTALYNNYVEKGQTFAAWGFTGTSDRSVENIHGNLHSALGCSNGFMTTLAASAFDPSFFLHHANVDRQWEIWAAIHYDEFMTQRMCNNENFARRPGIENQASSLYPFHSDASGRFHTPASMRYTKSLGYAYEEVPDWRFSTKDELAQYVLQLVAASNLQTSQTKAMKSPISNSSKRWWADSILDVEPGQSATLYYFFGEPPTDRKQWTTKSTLIFSQAFLPRNETRKRSTRLSLTPYLEEAVQTGALKDLQDVTVETFLKQQLRWRVTASDLFDQVSPTIAIVVQILNQPVVKVEKNGLIEYGPVNPIQNLSWGSAI